MSINGGSFEEKEMHRIIDLSFPWMDIWYTTLLGKLRHEGFMWSFWGDRSSWMMSICAIVCKLLGLLGKSPNNFGRQISALVHRAVAIPKQTVDGIRRLSFGLLGLLVWWRAEEKKRQFVSYLIWDESSCARKTLIRQPFSGLRSYPWQALSNSSLFSSVLISLVIKVFKMMICWSMNTVFPSETSRAYLRQEETAVEVIGTFSQRSQ